MLQGTVRKFNEFYVIEHEGASLQVPAEQVEMACGSLLDAYERRRLERVGASVDSHLELARWCLRNHLLDQAARETLDARLRDPNHPRLAWLDMEIRQALEIEASRRARAERKQLEAPAAPIPVESLAPTLHPPLEAQTQFVRSIQPMLVQGCATGGCHQPGASQHMQLDRWALEGNGNPELIRQNLESVLAQIDAADPASSPLILRARKSHGNHRDGMSKSLASYQAAMLLDWLNQATGAVSNPAAEASATIDQTTVSSAATTAARIEIQPLAKPAVQVEQVYAPRDAFDPEVFNRESAGGSQVVKQPAAEMQAVDESGELDAIGDEIEAAME